MDSKSGMDLGRAWHVGTIAERRFPHRLSLPAPTHEGGWIVSFRDHPEIVILDSVLNERQRLDLQAQSQQYASTAVALSPYGRLFALSSRTDLRIADRSGALLHRLSHPAWDAFTGSNCFFDFQDRLWYVRPGNPGGLDPRIVVVEPYSGVILYERAIENHVGYFDPIGYFSLSPSPDSESVLIEVGCGQDGSYLYRACLTGAGLSLQQYPFTDRTFLGGFAPGGREFVTGAHNGDAIMVHSFPDGRVVASIDAETLFAADKLHCDRPDQVGYIVIYLDEHHLLATTDFGRMLLLDRQPMRLLGTVWPEGYRLRSYDQHGRETDDPDRIMDYEGGLTTIHSAGRGRVLTMYRDNTLRLLDVSPLVSPGALPGAGSAG